VKLVPWIQIQIISRDSIFSMQTLHKIGSSVLIHDVLKFLGLITVAVGIHSLETMTVINKSKKLSTSQNFFKSVLYASGHHIVHLDGS
jgi:hypothetical protein